MCTYMAGLRVDNERVAVYEGIEVRNNEYRKSEIVNGEWCMEEWIMEEREIGRGTSERVLDW